MRFYLFPKYKTLISDTQAGILLVYLVDTINQHCTLFWQKKNACAQGIISNSSASAA
jgi:hypothetical protein